VATLGSVQGLHGPLTSKKKITGCYIATAVLPILLGVFAIVEPMCAGRSKGDHLPNRRRDRILGRRMLLADASALGHRNADVIAGSGNPDGRIGGGHFVVPPQEPGCIGMDTVQRNHHLYSWGDDLFSLAFEFRVDYRRFCRIDTVNDRHDPADVRTHSAKAHQIGGPEVYELQL
jgi:hypothetical protein